jgi:SAM-dependent methyltransferase
MMLVYNAALGCVHFVMTRVADPEQANEQRDAFALYRVERVRYWNDFAQSLDRWGRATYQRRLVSVYRSLIPPGMRVLELGCGQGDLLASLQPSRGVGVDFSERVLERAVPRHPELEFVHADVHEFLPNEKFDFIILSDLVNELWEVQRVLEMAAQCSVSSTRVVLNAYSRLWEIPRRLAEALRLARPQLSQNWLAREDLNNMLYLSGFETIRTFSEIMWPVRMPGIDQLCNRYLVRLGLFSWLGVTNFIVARPRPLSSGHHTVSVIVPARNEEGNIRRIFEETPDMGTRMELIFVEGHSRDNTFDTIRQEMERYPTRNAKLFRQSGTAKETPCGWDSPRLPAMF